MPHNLRNRVAGDSIQVVWHVVGPVGVLWNSGGKPHDKIPVTRKTDGTRKAYNGGGGYPHPFRHFVNGFATGVLGVLQKVIGDTFLGFAKACVCISNLGTAIHKIGSFMGDEKKLHPYFTPVDGQSQRKIEILFVLRRNCKKISHVVY
jgi:hypothetical protein